MAKTSFFEEVKSQRVFAPGAQISSRRLQGHENTILTSFGPDAKLGRPENGIALLELSSQALLFLRVCTFQGRRADYCPESLNLVSNETELKPSQCPASPQCPLQKRPPGYQRRVRPVKPPLRNTLPVNYWLGYGNIFCILPGQAQKIFSAVYKLMTRQKWHWLQVGNHDLEQKPYSGFCHAYTSGSRQALFAALSAAILALRTGLPLQPQSHHCGPCVWFGGWKCPHALVEGPWEEPCEEPWFEEPCEEP
ncbi:hypothetical protein AC579_8086 [Pseudocercospora musae]|uniref:Uncharacterized protein n=1 Tax=Pseudocercospora musae TaxID=113226 RepID=A0A139IFP3_9PEZI|nr:hypothetical protein AC579_8086 [Pseudocercospora musae]